MENRHCSFYTVAEGTWRGERINFTEILWKFKEITWCDELYTISKKLSGCKLCFSLLFDGTMTKMIKLVCFCMKKDICNFLSVIKIVFLCKLDLPASVIGLLT